MIYFCADDYGISKLSNTRIEECLKNGVLNKISILPNGNASDFSELIFEKNIKLSLHLNLIEGYPLSKKEDVSLLVARNGSFKYSFIGLLFISIFGNRNLLEKQIYNEIKAQIDFWKNKMGKKTPILIDSHQHTHMIPLVFKTLMRVITEENVAVEYLRIPNEPILPYIKSPSLYFKFSSVGLAKQWLLKFLNFVNRKEFKKSNIKSAAVMGILFSGQLSEDKINKLLPRYMQHNKNIEIVFHPGYLEDGESLIDGCRPNFEKFYYSKWRRVEYNTLINFRKD
ncbi:MAG: ChbG/HpnK family deacetylase [Acutalibacteraceae bacterium]|nr:ChbG/HpnK family deacetylase [Acutalibacteraceae bacterium]